MVAKDKISQDQKTARTGWIFVVEPIHEEICLVFKVSSTTGCPRKLDTPIFFLSVYYWIPPDFSKCLLLDTPDLRLCSRPSGKSEKKS